MGLDMYLSGEKFHWSSITEPNGAVRQEDGYPVETVSLRLGYWRKHPNLHGYIVQEFAGGVDDCREIRLNEENIRQIIDAIKNQDLPETSGFFFGESDGSEDAESIKIFNDALAWIDLPNADNGMRVSRTVVYRASW